MRGDALNPFGPAPVGAPSAGPAAVTLASQIATLEAITARLEALAVQHNLQQQALGRVLYALQHQDKPEEVKQPKPVNWPALTMMLVGVAVVVFGVALAWKDPGSVERAMASINQAVNAGVPKQ